VTDVVIVGGGIAGLSAAWELVQRGVRPLVLEREGRAGGVIRTDLVDGFVIDAGPDALLIQKPAALDLCRELGLGDRLFPTLTPRTAFIVRRGRLIPLPEASVLGIPTRIGPFLTTPLFSLKGKLRMAMELLIPPRRDSGDESIGSFIGRRFGSEAVTYLAEPLLAGIHAGDVHRLSMLAAFPRLVEAERSRGSVLRALSAIRTNAGSSPGAFMSLPGGIEEMVTALLQRLPSGTVHTGASVAALRGHRRYDVLLESGESLQARSVIIATPAWAAAPLLKAMDARIGALVEQVRYVSSATVAIGLRRDQVGHPLQGSGFVVPKAERHVVMAASWVSSKWPHRAPDGHVLLRGFVGGAHDPAIVDQHDGTIGSAVFDELRGMLQISAGPRLMRVYRWRRASAQHEVGHLERMAEIDRRLSAYPGLYVTGSGFRGTGIPDCVLDGRATARQAAAFLEKVAV
jgi:protoporphyrinogen/coproporphyrinogen III oxidase